MCSHYESPADEQLALGFRVAVPQQGVGCCWGLPTGVVAQAEAWVGGDRGRFDLANRDAFSIG